LFLFFSIRDHPIDVFIIIILTGIKVFTFKLLYCLVARMGVETPGDFQFYEKNGHIFFHFTSTPGVFFSPSLLRLV